MRMVICDPEKDSLAEVIRRLGLTGTKIGCGTGQCGACSVILNGEVVRSCIRKMKNVPEFSAIETIEGFGTPQKLHPVQQAWITHGGVQCGFCSPGFIVSAKALLEQNLSPTREEVRDWFQKHKNVCRCTGYKPLVDAVMAAAKVMRGEMTMEELSYKPDSPKSIYGSKYPRPAALAKVTGLCDFGDDIKLKMPPETLHLALVQPKITSHAKILSIDISKAEAMDGVVKVVTAKDIKGTNRVVVPVVHPRSTEPGTERPILADEKIYRYGDVVAVVLARTEAIARQAAKLVDVKIEPLPEYMNFLDAVAPDALRIHQGPNVYMFQPVHKGRRADEVMEESHCVAEGSFYTQREPHLSIEGDTMQGYWDTDGNLTIHCKTQAVGWHRAGMAGGIGFDIEKIRIIENPTGASFGWAASPGSFAIMGACLMAVDSPMTLTMSYEEHQHFSGKRTSSYGNSRMACDKDGRITALEFDIGVDHGPYTEVSDHLMDKFARFVGFPYSIPNVSGLCRIAHTNHNFGTAYRGFGSPQSYSNSEALMDMLADQMGIDRFEFRYKNIARQGDTNINSAPYRDYPMEKLMDMIKPHYEKAVSEAKAKSTDKKKRGVGLVCGGFACTLSPHDHSEVALELHEDGTVTCYNTWEDQGQGGDIGSLTLTHEALKPLGLSPEQIKLVMNDSHVCPDSGIAAGSRLHYMAGNAIINAAEQLLNAMRKQDGSFRSFAEMQAENIPTKYLGVYDVTGSGLIEINPNTGVGDSTQDFNYGVFLSEVEVDVETGKTTVLSMRCAGDVGKIGNLLAVEGQGYGGISHTIGYALSEEYSDLKRHSTIAGAGIPYIKDIPDNIELMFHETHRKNGPFGSSGCSELFQSSSHMAVINGINDAVGVRIYDLPARPAKVKAAMEARAAGKDMKPKKYFLGSDLYDALDDLAANPV